MSESNRVGIRYAPEVTYDTAPTSGNVQDLRYASHNLAANPQTVVSDELRSDRMVQDLVKVSEQVGGDIGVEFSLLTYDELWEALLGGTWTTDVLKNGVEQRSFSVSVDMNDWTTPEYFLYTGMRVASGGINLSYGQLATGSIAFAGATAAAPSTTQPLAGTGFTPVAKTTTDVLNGSSDLGSVQIDAGAPGSIIRSIALNVDNTMRPIEGVGNVGPSNQAYGRSRVTGSLEMYFDDTALYTKLLANTTAALTFNLADGTNTWAFNLPKIKLASGVPAVSGVDTDVFIPFEFEAIYDSGIDASIEITRS